MSGAWAREADEVRLRSIEAERLLTTATYWLTQALVCTAPGAQRAALRMASGAIRRERRRLDPDGMTAKHSDWGDKALTENDRLIWVALERVAGAATRPDNYAAWHLREAEAALRTLHKRGRA